VPPSPKGPAVLAWPIRLVIAAVVVLCMLLLAVAVLALGHYSSRQNAIANATRTAQDAGRLITEQARRMLEPAQSTLRHLSFDPIARAGSLDERLDRLPVLLAELSANRLLSSLFVGYGNGDFILARPLDRAEVRRSVEAPVQAAFLVQSVALQPDGTRTGEYLFFSGERQLVERRPQPDYRFDPRTRPWYGAAVATTTPVQSLPYVFFTTRQVGLTLSQRSAAGGSVIGIDVVLDELADRLAQLRVTPNTRMALVTARQEVLAHPDRARVLKIDGETIALKTLAELDEPGLTQLARQADRAHPVVQYTTGRDEWLGVSLDFDVWQAQGMQLLVAMPSTELVGDSERRRLQMIGMMAGVAVLLLPVGWKAGASIGRNLDRLSRRAKRIGRFEFADVRRRKTSWIREVNDLSRTMDGMGTTIDSFLRISETMAHEPQVERMLEQVLHQFVDATRCDGGAVYLLDVVQGRMVLSASAGALPSPPGEDFVYSANRDASESTQGRMTLELRGRTGQLEGLLILHHDGDDAHGNENFAAFARRLSSMLALSIETRQLIESQKKLLDAVIRLMADAIDAKSPYTGGHCERVPQLATLLAERMMADPSGPYASFTMTEDERYEFHLGAWLHDCGKVTSPEHIVDKATKLETLYNRLHEIRMRFEVLWRDAEIEHLQRLARGEATEPSQRLRDERQRSLQDDFTFIAQCNIGGEFMADDAIERLHRIGRQTWLRHFDNRIGVSAEELERLRNTAPEAPPLPVAEPLLADRAEHLVPWTGPRPPVEKHDPANRYGFDMVLPAHKQHLGELHNLSIRRGTLTDEDRFRINDHIVQTYIMLKGLPWPRQLARVPEIAATHHEKLNGQGYPRRLAAPQLTVVDRVMALADIFEALTAGDRPYKAAKTLSESLRIMAFMCKDQHLDTELFRYFLRSGVWRDFADRHMQPAQIDTVDIAAIERLLPEAPATP
jgi:HD-GYP domain-containing protein (c-di-GMP phosphodiesterase class II)